MESFGDAMRGPRAFGPAVEPPPDADDQGRLLAFLGRRPVEQAGLPAGPGRRIPAEVGDARVLRAGDGSVDAVLLLGPLYHLTDRAERLQALDEARRVVRQGGPVFVAAISRFASLLDGL